ncbi:hypothetical protein B0T16DRAFT_441382 [Cercophora newfieldiana]|uniref:Uncharacterized protein n=1 Tax=Cercophora newfieldiana TaxID=92897 RepID=A0AA39YR87_9PEZI|nr:hypothetical protein B0T16DRAFT_441382 [Cercophora newfieldiana]
MPPLPLALSPALEARLETSEGCELVTHDTHDTRRHILHPSLKIKCHSCESHWLDGEFPKIIWPHFLLSLTCLEALQHVPARRSPSEQAVESLTVLQKAHVPKRPPPSTRLFAQVEIDRKYRKAPPPDSARFIKSRHRALAREIKDAYRGSNDLKSVMFTMSYITSALPYSHSKPSVTRRLLMEHQWSSQRL